jgi:hypothetical protein
MTTNSQKAFEEWSGNKTDELINDKNERWYWLTWQAAWHVRGEFDARVCEEAETKSAPGYNYEDGYADAMHDAKLLIRKKGSE